MAFSPRTCHLENLLWHEVRDLVSDGIRRVLIPCGATEAHGATGLGTDTIIPRGLAERLAPELEALIAPSVSYGVLGSLRAYPGSVSLSHDTYTSLITEIGQGLADSGFKELIFLNGHSGNRDGLKTAGYRLHVERRVRTLVYNWYEEPDNFTLKIYDGPGGHSGAGETGMVTALEPEAAPHDAWSKDEAGTLNPAVIAYPGPFPIILVEEDNGLPDYDPGKAGKLLDAVADVAKRNIQRILERWEKLDI